LVRSPISKSSSVVQRVKFVIKELNSFNVLTLSPGKLGQIVRLSVMKPKVVVAPGKHLQFNLENYFLNLFYLFFFLLFACLLFILFFIMIISIYFCYSSSSCCSCCSCCSCWLRLSYCLYLRI
jgi:hypothetical protein